MNCSSIIVTIIGMFLVNYNLFGGPCKAKVIYSSLEDNKIYNKSRSQYLDFELDNSKIKLGKIPIDQVLAVVPFYSIIEDEVNSYNLVLNDLRLFNMFKTDHNLPCVQSPQDSDIIPLSTSENLQLLNLLQASEVVKRNKQEDCSGLDEEDVYHGFKVYFKDKTYINPGYASLEECSDYKVKSGLIEEMIKLHMKFRLSHKDYRPSGTESVVTSN